MEECLGKAQEGLGGGFPFPPIPPLWEMGVYLRKRGRAEGKEGIPPFLKPFYVNNYPTIGRS